MECIQAPELPAPAGVFGAHRPARAVVPVPALHYGFLVEVQLVTERPNG
ncbi:hypothetical protein ACWV27_17790 [Massilia varians]